MDTLLFDSKTHFGKESNDLDIFLHLFNFTLLNFTQQAYHSAFAISKSINTISAGRLQETES